MIMHVMRKEEKVKTKEEIRRNILTSTAESTEQEKNENKRGNL